MQIAEKLIFVLAPTEALYKVPQVYCTFKFFSRSMPMPQPQGHNSQCGQLRLPHTTHKLMQCYATHAKCGIVTTSQDVFINNERLCGKTPQTSMRP